MIIELSPLEKAGKRFKEVRTSKNVSHKYLAAKTRINRNKISLFERGLYNIMASDLYILCKVLNISPGLLFDASDQEFESFTKISKYLK